MGVQQNDLTVGLTYVLSTSSTELLSVFASSGHSIDNRGAFDLTVGLPTQQGWISIREKPISPARPAETGRNLFLTVSPGNNWEKLAKSQ